MHGYINYISIYTSLSENEIIFIVHSTAGFRAEVFHEDLITLYCCHRLEKKIWRNYGEVFTSQTYRHNNLFVELADSH